MARIRDNRAIQQEQCPARGYGLTHTQDGYACADCGVSMVGETRRAVPLEFAPVSAFTIEEARHLVFLRWL